MVAHIEIPKCVAIIMDGNRRWAKKKGLPVFEGHRQGMERLREVVCWVRDREIKHLAVYAFSIENWGRGKKEISYLMKLFSNTAKSAFIKLAKENIRIRFAGELNSFDKKIQSIISHVEEMSEKNKGLTLWICLSYGGRAEIVEAVKSAGKEINISEKIISSHLWTASMPDPDLIIRTGGEKRLSGFLTWQSIYSELFFRDEYWPDFNEAILDSILNEYKKRDRRMGK